MKFRPLEWSSTVVLGAVLWGSTAGRCQTMLSEGAGTSSSVSKAELPDAPAAAAVVVPRGDRSKVKIQYQTNMRRFSRLALALNVGGNGIGLEAATPLTNRWNLRGGGDFLGGNYTLKVTSSTASSSFGATLPGNAIDVIIQPHFRSAMVSADFFPRYGGFHISPGLTVYNGNRATILATVEGGQQIDVGGGSYTSDPNDPIRAVLQAQLGRAVAPRLTVGWGNVIPRDGKHFSFPVEVGVEYVGAPSIALSLAGSECDMGGGCYPVSVDPKTQTNILDEQKQLNTDIAPLRFYPIVSSGVSYRF